MKKIIGIMAALTYFCSITLAKEDNQVIDNPIHPKRLLEIIDSVSVALNEFYIFPDVAKEIEKYIRKQYNENNYRNIASTVKFVERLTDDIRLVSKDAHLSVEFKSDEYFTSDKSDTTAGERLREWYDEQAYNNFGFTKVERLPGNVAYVQMRGFYDTD